MDRGLRVDHYRTLGVAQDASTREIRRAYRRLARQHHPDVSPSDDARHFVAVTGAYKVLSDPAARARYDRTLPATPSPRPAPEPTVSPAHGPTRVGILELSPEEGAQLMHHSLVLTDGNTIIRLPTGLGHGDTIALHDHGCVTVLQIQISQRT